MNEIKICGNLRKEDKKYEDGHLYLLEVKRKSGFLDKLMVLSPDDTLTCGSVCITGHIKSDYIEGLGVPVFIIPDMVESVGKDDRELKPENGDYFSRTTITGKLKTAPVCRKIKDGFISTVLVVTEDGTVPVLLWNDTAKAAAEKYKAKDEVKVSGRLQSRDYPDKNGVWHTTYELSARKFNAVKHGSDRETG